MKFYATSKLEASIRVAHEAFTHVHLKRNYWTVRPVFLRGSRIADLPVYVWASWQPACAGQLARWQSEGGVLMDREAHSRKAGASDVVVVVECPMNLADLEECAIDAREYCIVPRPVSWEAHMLSVDLRTPSRNELLRLWRHCKGRRISDRELAELAGIPAHHIATMRRQLRPREEWEIRARLAPDAPALMDAWEWVAGGRISTKQEVRLSGHRPALKEMARRGHITVEKFQIYRDKVDWSPIAKKRAVAREGLAQVRKFVESLPDHLPGE